MRPLLAWIFTIATAGVARADTPFSGCDEDKDGQYEGCSSDSNSDGCNENGNGCTSSRAASVGSSLALLAAVAYGIGRRRKR
jgi:uncharacterized protein (TIGR03382 family)